ncbi:MAG: HEPN domain-containing protein [Armatimonadota bacterium]|nr:HEPN domain-containing protein [Armatimonadota bacterium]MDR7471008.1 HEPN domain-containing protein [Armatimonadota bacterium]
MAERSRDWVEQARRDLESARLQAEGGFFEWACFVSQQAAEKAVRAGRMPGMRSVVQSRSYASVKVFWLNSGEALARLRAAAEKLLAEQGDVAAVYLFGSLSEDRAVPGSDADLLILLERSQRRLLDRAEEFSRYFSGIGMPVELFCYTREEAERIRLARAANDRGILLAGR